MTTIPYRNSRTRLKLIICVLLIASAIASYCQVMGFDFIDMDDAIYVTENTHVRSGFTFDGLAHSFTTFDLANWHPITWISHMLDCEIYGLNPMGHHWTNLQFHTVNTVLLFFLLNQITGTLWRSAVVAALFGLHPLHVESVAWISERKDVLSTFWGILALMFYGRYAKRNRIADYLSVVILLSLGLMSKPMVVTFPFLMLLLDFWPLKRIRHPLLMPLSNEISQIPQRSLSYLIAEKIPLFVLVTVSSVLTYWAQKQGGAVGTFEAFAPVIRIATAMISYASYLFKAFWPYPLAVFYPHPGTNISYINATGAAIMILGVSFAAIRVANRYPYISVGWFWYLGTLVPVIGLVQVGTQGMADRYTYIPLIGVFILATWGINDLLKNRHWRKPFLAIFAGCVLVILASCTFLQSRHWKNNITLFEHAVHTIERNAVAHNNLGNALLYDVPGRLNEAIFHIQKALEISPDNVNALFNMAVAHTKQGDSQSAIYYFQSVLEKKPDHLGAHLNLGSLLAEEERVDDAITHFKKVLCLDPGNAPANINLAILMSNQNSLEEAARYYIKALDINPDDVDANYNYSVLLLRQGKKKEAMIHALKALTILHTVDSLKIKPFYAKVYFDWGVELSVRGRHEQAKVFLKKALEIKPDYAEAQNYMNLLEKMTSETDM